MSALLAERTGSSWFWKAWIHTVQVLPLTDCPLVWTDDSPACCRFCDPEESYEPGLEK